MYGVNRVTGKRKIDCTFKVMSKAWLFLLFLNIQGKNDYFRGFFRGFLKLRKAL